VPNLTVLRTAGQQIFFRYRTDLTAAGTTVADGDHWRMSAQGYHYVGRLGLLGEYVWSTQEVRRATEAADLTNQAWQLATSWVLTGEMPSHRAIQPKRVFDPGRGTWGAIELTARANGLRVDRSSFPVFANPESSAEGALGWAAGVNWYLNRAVKLTLNYEETHFDGGTAAGDRPVERDVLSRFQVAF